MNVTADDDRSRTPVFWIFIVIIMLILLSVIGFRAIQTQPVAGIEGSIALPEVTLSWNNDELIFGVQAAIDLPATMQTGLDNGVPLTFIMDLRLLRPRTGWFDETVVEFQNRYTLTYYELTRHYRVHAVQTNTSHNYRSLSSALTGLGKFEEIRYQPSEQEKQQLEDKAGLIGSLRLLLDTAALPLPLQPLIRSSWNLASEEYRWSVI